jgi:nucleotide-binding universal stress UspA family protein
MSGLQSILAATDFSDDAANAVERAARLGADAGLARGAVVHVIEESWFESLRRFANLTADAEQSVVAQAKRTLDELAEAVRGRTGFALERELCVGSVLDMILGVLDDFDVLALGARGRNPLRDFAIGTTAERLLRRTAKPILVVKRGAQTAYRRAVVAVDFSPHSRRALALGAAAAPRAELHLTHVYAVPFEGNLRYAGVSDEAMREYGAKARRDAEDEMNRFIRDCGIESARMRCLIEHGGHVSTVLRDRARELGADLVVVGKHGKSLTEHLLIGSVTLHLLAECPCDVLVT